MEAGYKRRSCNEYEQKLNPALVAQARLLANDDNMVITDIARLLNQNYMTIFEAVKGKTWKTTAGPDPQIKTATHKCTHCGILTTKRSSSNVHLCRYCRQEKTV